MSFSFDPKSQKISQDKACRLVRVVKISLFLFVIGCLEINAQDLSVHNKTLSINDKSTILKQVFDHGFNKLMADTKFSECTIPIVLDKQVILIETTEPKTYPIPPDNFQFVFMGRQALEKEIKSNNGDCYLKIAWYQGKKDKDVKVTLWRWVEMITVVNGKSWYPARYVSASGLTYSASKSSQKWNVRLLDSVWAVS